MAGSLTDAAYLSFDKCAVLQTAATLSTHFAAFIAAVQPVFSDAVDKDRPVGNWLVPMYALSQQNDQFSLDFFGDCVQFLYRICYAGATQFNLGNITSGQATALLAAWNAHIGP